MKTLAATMLILAGCASQAIPPPKSEPIGGQRVIDFSDRQQVYKAFQDAYKVGDQLIPIPPELENRADAFCIARAGGRSARALGIDLAQGVPICYAAVPPLSIAQKVCESLSYAVAEVEGPVIICRGPVKPSAVPIPGKQVEGKGA